MKKYIKYKRFVNEFDNEGMIQDFLDDLITDGWEIIYYDETPKTVTTLTIIILAGKIRTELL